MRKSLFAWVILCAITLLLLNCGRDQELVSIQVQPASETFGTSSTPLIDNQGTQVQLQALGSYIHPPVTKDITNQVAWSSNTPQMMTVDASGLLTVTGLACGSTLISATVTTNKSSGGISSPGAIVTGYFTGNVTCFTSSGGGGGTNNPILTIGFLGSGQGTVAVSPGSFSCSTPNPCSTQLYQFGTSLTLTATASSGFTFAGWQNCQSATNVCTFDLAGNTTVTATFN